MEDRHERRKRKRNGSQRGSYGGRSARACRRKRRWRKRFGSEWRWGFGNVCHGRRRSSIGVCATDPTPSACPHKNLGYEACARSFVGRSAQCAYTKDTSISSSNAAARCWAACFRSEGPRRTEATDSRACSGHFRTGSGARGRRKIASRAGASGAAKRRAPQNSSGACCAVKRDSCLNRGWCCNHFAHEQTAAGDCSAQRNCLGTCCTGHAGTCCD